jgi:glutaredoxin-like YruB-family protein
MTTNNTDNKKVIIYSTPTCHYCNVAKDYFTDNQIDYTEHNVAENPVARTEMVQLTGQLGVPVIKIGDEVVVGFSEPHIRALLEA